MRKSHVIAAALALAGASGCSPAPAPAPSPPPPPGPSAAAPGPGRLISCGVELPEDWRRGIDAARLPGAADSTTIVATGDGGDRSFAKVLSGGRMSLVMLVGGARHEIVTLERGQDVFGFDFDGRWLTFGMGYDPRRKDEWAAFAWDSAGTAAPGLIADNRGGGPGPWFFTSAHKGKAAWVQGVGDKGDRAAIHLRDLASGVDTVIAEGTVNSPVFFGDLLVWRDVDQTTKYGRFQAMSIVDGSRVEPPEPLRHALADQHVAADERTIVWVSDELRTLHAWRADWPAPRKLAEIEPGSELPGIQYPKVAGELVSWVSGRSFVTDVRTGSTFHSTEVGYWLEAHGGALVASLSTGDDAESRAPSVVRADALSPLPPC